MSRFLLLLFFSTTLCATDCELINLPESFTVTQKLLSSTSGRSVSFEVKKDDSTLGYLFLSNHFGQELYMRQNRYFRINASLPEIRIATHYKKTLIEGNEQTSYSVPTAARLNWFTKVPRLNVMGKTNGYIEADLTYLYPTFRLFQDNQLKAIASMNFWNTECILKDAYDQHTIATIHIPFFRLSDYWKVSIADSAAISKEKIHPHMLLLLLAFQAENETFRKREPLRKEQKEKIEQDINRYLSRSLESVHASSQRDQIIQKLKIYHSMYKKIKPRKKDFDFVAQLPKKHKWPNPDYMNERQFYSYVQTLMPLLHSKQFSKKQKKAFLLYIEHAMHCVK